MPSAATKDILSIVIRLTVTCLLAGLIMGLAYIFTHDARERNEQARDNQVTLSLLGYDRDNPAPKTMSMHTVYRYVLTENGTQSIGYLLPTGENYAIVVLDTEGSFLQKIDVETTAQKLRNAGERDAAVTAAVNAGMRPADAPRTEARYADAFTVVTNDGRRVAYILDGKYPGFKTSIRVKMALDADFTMLGFEVLEHEEDPGLGAEIEQPWFRGQFAGKTLEQLGRAHVVREPMPDEFRAAITGKITGDDAARIRGEHVGDDIYALTGATISSRSVLQGNQAMVRKFAYRMHALDAAVASQNLKTAY